MCNSDSLYSVEALKLALGRNYKKPMVDYDSRAVEMILAELRNLPYLSRIGAHHRNRGKTFGR